MWGDIDYSRLLKVGIWAWAHMCRFSFSSRLRDWGTIMFQLSGFYCAGTAALRGLCEVCALMSYYQELDPDFHCMRFCLCLQTPKYATKTAQDLYIWPQKAILSRTLRVQVGVLQSLHPPIYLYYGPYGLY